MNYKLCESVVKEVTTLLEVKKSGRSACLIVEQLNRLEIQETIANVRNDYRMFHSTMS